MPDCGLVYVYWEEAGGFCRGHIKSVNVQYRDGDELFRGDEYRWLPAAAEKLASAEKEKKRKKETNQGRKGKA